MPERGLRRPCRDDERMWRNHCVDRNLDDRWLEALNALHSFTLINICEGHGSRRANSHPHIYVRLKPAMADVLPDVWIALSADEARRLGNFFDVERSSITVELKLRLHFVRGSRVARRDLVTKIDALQPRSSPTLEPEIPNWFDQTVRGIHELDQFVLTLSQRGHETT